MCNIKIYISVYQHNKNQYIKIGRPVVFCILKYVDLHFCTSKYAVAVHQNKQHNIL